MAVFLLMVVIALGKIQGVAEIASNEGALKFIILSGVAGALSWLFYFLALQSGSVSQVAPIDGLSVVFALILAALFLGEKAPLHNRGRCFDCRRGDGNSAGVNNLHSERNA
jgi:transporter family protein